jgi:hypothetical protein
LQDNNSFSIPILATVSAAKLTLDTLDDIDFGRVERGYPEAVQRMFTNMSKVLLVLIMEFFA